MQPTTARLPRWFLTPVFKWSLCIVGAVLLGAIGFELLGISVFESIGIPHEYCYVRDPQLIWLHGTSDFLIGAAYVSISFTLAYLVFKASKGIPFHWVFLAFGLFIVSCGLTHFMEVWVIWSPVYWASGYVKLVTAAASVATATAMFPLVPKIFALIDAAAKGEQRRVEIERLNQELERFNYSVAHDLRAPLRGLGGFSQALKEDFADQLPDDAKEYIDRMQTSVERMDRLITDLLRYATIGRQQLALKPVPLAEVFGHATALLEATIQQQQAEIVLPPQLPTVYGDPSLLQVVFQNLLSNSLKFVAPGERPRIEVTVENLGQDAVVSVTDNGIGLPSGANDDNVFGMFERFHDNYPGTGIGLAIAHRAAERMGGTISLGPAPQPTGTRFRVRLRLVR